MDYNGWTNRDTWLVVVWVDNHYKNYMDTIRFLDKKKVSDYTDEQIINFIKSLHYGDLINWNKVNWEEIKEYLKDYER